MANPYFIEPSNPLQALMLGVQGYDRSRKLGKEQQTADARRLAGETFSAGGDTRSVLGQLIGLGDAETVKALGSMGPKDTDDQREYHQAVKQGFKGNLLDYITTVKRAGANQNTINMPPQEKAYDAKVGSEFAEQNIGIIKGANEAQRKIGTLDRLGQLLKDPKVYTGAGGESVLQMKRIAKSLGMNVEGVSDAEAARSISNQFALELRNPAGGAGMPGAMSDKDREFLQASVPSLQQTPEGNAKIVDYMKRVAGRAVEVEKLRQGYVKRYGRLNEGFHQAVRDYSETNPLFPEGAQPAPQQQQQPRRLKFNPATGSLE
jgi:hypothetical protein